MTSRAERVLVATQCFPPRHGGIETLMDGLAGALATLGRDVVVFADAPGSAGRRADGAVVLRFGGWKPLRRWRKAHAVAAALRRGPALLIADSWKSLESLSASALRGHPVLCLAHGMEFPAAPTPRKRRRIAEALAKADVVAAVSGFTAGLVAPYGPRRLRVVPPAIAPQPEPDPAELAALRRIVGDGGPVVATLARLEPRKGVDMTLRAVAALLPAHPALRYVVAGAGPDQPRLRALAAELGVRERITFLGRVDEARRIALMALADVFAMPARREGASVEGFGIVYLEAAWQGAPALAGREGGSVDAVVDGVTGLLCDGADPADVARALSALLSDPAARARMGAAAAARARARAWPGAAAQWLEALDA